MNKELGVDYHFSDYDDASKQLIASIPVGMFAPEDSVVIGVSEGGVYFADKIASAIGSKMDILLTEPIFAPFNSEVTIAMISETKEVVIHKALIEAFDITEDYVYSEADRRYEEKIINYIYKYRKGKELLSLKGKYVILVDECVETGLTMMIALKSAIERGAKNIYIATPILDNCVYQNLLTVCDGVYCPNKIDDYISIDHYYKNFETFEFDDVENILKNRDLS